MRDQAYEGRYPHFYTEVEIYKDSVLLRKGDFIVCTKKQGIRYLLESLGPIAEDSFFNWNFFDSVLQQKEHFSPYIFENQALQLIEKDSLLKKEFASIKKADKKFRKDGYSQLDWIYKHSGNYEKSPFTISYFQDVVLNILSGKGVLYSRKILLKLLEPFQSSSILLS